MKNSIFALRILHKADAKFIPMIVVDLLCSWFVSYYLQGIVFLQRLLGLIESGGSYPEFVKTVALIVGSCLVIKVFEFTGAYISEIAGQRIYKTLNHIIIEKAARTDIECYENPEFYNKYQRALEILSESRFMSFGYSFAAMISNIVTGAFIARYIVSVEPLVIAALFIGITAAIVIAQTVKSRTEHKKNTEMSENKRQKAYMQRVVFLKDYAKDMRTSNIYTAMYRRFRNAVVGNIGIIKKYGVRIFLLESFVGLFAETLPIISVYGYGAYRFAIKRNLKVSQFSVLMTAVSNLQAIIDHIVHNISAIQQQAVYFQDLQDFLSYELKIKNGTREAEEMECIELKNVSFTYPDAKDASLENVSLTLSRGETVAVVGKNGAGKTTLVKLLLRFYDPSEGEILYNGIPLPEYDLASLRGKIAAVFQDYKVFALTVNENVICRECDSDDKLRARDAMDKSGILPKVDELPRGADTFLTREFDSKGAGLSGGEAQKVAVARLFARSFDLAVLDEPSSALDPVAEHNMYRSLVDKTQGKTVIYISHRLSSAVMSDKIFVFDGGRLAETGKHSELMSRNGIYSDMFTKQASNYSEEATV